MSVDDLCWAQMDNYPFWPSLRVHDAAHEMVPASLRSDSGNRVLVMFFGDMSFYRVQTAKVLAWDTPQSAKFRKAKGKQLLEAIAEADEFAKSPYDVMAKLEELKNAAKAAEAAKAAKAAARRTAAAAAAKAAKAATAKAAKADDGGDGDDAAEAKKPVKKARPAVAKKEATKARPASGDDDDDGGDDDDDDDGDDDDDESDGAKASTTKLVKRTAGNADGNSSGSSDASPTVKRAKPAKPTRRIVDSDSDDDDDGGDDGDAAAPRDSAEADAAPSRNKARRKAITSDDEASDSSDSDSSVGSAKASKAPREPKPKVKAAMAQPKREGGITRHDTVESLKPVRPKPRVKKPTPVAPASAETAAPDFYETPTLRSLNQRLQEAFTQDDANRAQAALRELRVNYPILSIAQIKESVCGSLGKDLITQALMRIQKWNTRTGAARLCADDAKRLATQYKDTVPLHNLFVPRSVEPCSIAGPVRLNCLVQLFTQLHDYFQTQDRQQHESKTLEVSLTDEEILKMALDLEAAVCERHCTGATADAVPQQSAAYTQHVRMLHFNLQKNAHVLNSLRHGLSAAEVAGLSASDLSSAEMRAKHDAIMAQSLDRAMIPTDEEAATDQFQCPRCKKWATTFRQAQTRSADEPMTTFIKCVSCSFRWKEG